MPGLSSPRTGRRKERLATGDSTPACGLVGRSIRVSVIRNPFTGKQIIHRGSFFTVEQARVYNCRRTPLLSISQRWGPRAARLAGRIRDGYQSIMPSQELVSEFGKAGGAGKPIQAGFKVCHSPTKEDGVRTAHSCGGPKSYPES